MKSSRENNLTPKEESSDLDNSISCSKTGNEVWTDLECVFDELPDSVEHIHLGNSFNQIIRKFPASLLSFECESDHDLTFVECDFPEHLEELIIDQAWEFSAFLKTLPAGLKKLACTLDGYQHFEKYAHYYSQ